MGFNSMSPEQQEKTLKALEAGRLKAQANRRRAREKREKFLRTMRSEKSTIADWLGSTKLQKCGKCEYRQVCEFAGGRAQDCVLKQRIFLNTYQRSASLDPLLEMVELISIIKTEIIFSKMMLEKTKFVRDRKDYREWLKMLHIAIVDLHKMREGIKHKVDVSSNLFDLIDSITHDEAIAQEIHNELNLTAVVVKNDKDNPGKIDAGAQESAPEIERTG